MTRPVLVFIGDSVTDCGRMTDPSGRGDGYVRKLSDAPQLARCDVVNRGISGERVRDLRRRWHQDVLSQRPALVSVLVGINDTWRRFDSADPTSAQSFEDDYRSLLEQTHGTPLVLIEPFLLPVVDGQDAWRSDLDEKIQVVRSLAREFDAVLVPADGALNLLDRPESLAPDGVHPSPYGHDELARLWLLHATPLVNRITHEDVVSPSLRDAETQGS